MHKFRKTKFFISSVSSFRIFHLRERYNPVHGNGNKNTLSPGFFLLPALILLFLTSCGRNILKDTDHIENFLSRQGLSYTVDQDGDYRIDKNENLPVRDVWIRGRCNRAGLMGIREIFTVSSLDSQKELDRLAPILLVDNMQTRVMGSWSAVKEPEQNQFLVLYIIKAPLNADRRYALQALKEASEAALILEKVLACREDS